nr:hypothetical protein [Tanacetum cinerariifolium]
MFDRAIRSVNTFKDFKTELVEGKEKRAGEELILECTKKQKVEDDKEKAKLKQLIEIIPYEEEVAIDAIPLAVKEDLEDLFKLEKARYGSTRPVESMDYLLWSDIKTMFEPLIEVEIYMLVEKKYPFTPPTLSMMLQKKLQIDYERIRSIQVGFTEHILDDVVYEVDQPQDDADPKNDKSTWFKQPPRLETPNPWWNKDQTISDEPEQTWFNDLVNAEKDSLTFDERMETLIDFSKFAMNRLKLDKITKAYLVGPVYKLLKGTCKSSIELEYNMDQCYIALTNQLD